MLPKKDKENVAGHEVEVHDLQKTSYIGAYSYMFFSNARVISNKRQCTCTKPVYNCIQSHMKSRLLVKNYKDYMKHGWKTSFAMHL